MDHSTMTLIGIVLLSIAACLLGRAASRRAFARSRAGRLGAQDVLRVDDPKLQHAYEAILDAVSRAYRVDRGLIRSSDCISSFEAVDSWDLGLGEERFREFVASSGLDDRFSSSLTLMQIAIELSARGASPHDGPAG